MAQLLQQRLRRGRVFGKDVLLISYAIPNENEALLVEEASGERCQTAGTPQCYAVQFRRAEELPPGPLPSRMHKRRSTWTPAEQVDPIGFVSFEVFRLRPNLNLRVAHTGTYIGQSFSGGRNEPQPRLDSNRGRFPRCFEWPMPF